MHVLFSKQFEKDILKIKDLALIDKIDTTIQSVKNASSFSEIRNFKKLSGYKNKYRIRIGDYRIGIFVDNNVIEFSRFLHRKEIYRYFP